MSKFNISTLEDPKSYISEAYRTMRTNIQFSSAENKNKVIMITSAEPGEGKTTTSINLGVTMAQTESRTLIMDCDMRNPKIHRIFKLSNILGLSDLLISISSFGDAIQKTEVEGLFVLAAGTRPPNPSELLSAEKMREIIEEAKLRFEYIIIDTPPVLMVTDAQIISKYADGSVIVVSSGESDRKSVTRSVELLKRVNAKILGTVLNKYVSFGKGHFEKGYYAYYSRKNAKRKRKKSIKRLD